MSTIDDDDRNELASLTRGVREHLMWLERGGCREVPREMAGNIGSPDETTRTVAMRVSPASAATSTRDAQPLAPLLRPDPQPHHERPRAPAPDDAGMQLGDSKGAQGLALIRSDLGDCQRCKLAGGRRNIVFGVGNPEAALVFVGEGPGEDEDRQGEPFVGKAGQLLDRMIVAMGLLRSEVYICNVVKCRPPDNRTPETDEIAACLPFLERQLTALGPRILVTLGKTAAATLLKTNAPIGRYRGQFHSYRDIPVMPTWHPAYLLRTPSAKRDAWEDLQKVMAELDRMGIPRRPTAPAGPR